MEIKYKNIGKNAGVYKIVNIINNRIYIGSTAKIKSRANGHRLDLEMNRHGNYFLQNDYNKCGVNAFIFEELEIIIGIKQQRLDREQYYLDQYYDNQKQCYNLRKDVCDDRAGIKNKIGPKEDCGWFRERTPEEREKMSKILKETWSDPALKEQSKINAYKQWSVVSFPEYTLTNFETKETVTINSSIRGWCQERGLSYKAMHQLVQGKIKSSGGWFLGTEEPEYIDRKGEIRGPISLEAKEGLGNRKYEGTVLLNKFTGEEITVTGNLKIFAESIGVLREYTTLMKTLSPTNPCKTVKGWQVKELIIKPQ